MFVKTDTILDRILARKVEDLTGIMRERPQADLEVMIAKADPPRDFAAALRRGEHVALIAEVKKASPSKGVLIEDFHPVQLGLTYEKYGAAALSVLTDEPFFQGHIEFLPHVHTWVWLPILRKDFIVDPYQVYEARAYGADAILLIVAALADAQMAELHMLAASLGLAVLVEVHDESELERALKIGASLIGVNNRDLKTFQEDLTTTARIARLVPSSVTLVAESAIRSAEDVCRMGELGAHAVLVGEGLVKADSIAEQVRMFSSQKRRTSVRED